MAAERQVVGSPWDLMLKMLYGTLI